ncbi:hypothetical protein DOY81_010169, partial [Sarcophaga bullata]
FLILTLMLVMLTLCEARGGGGRRGGGGGSGGSFGGLFGNWRKSKKQSSSNVSSRRVASSSVPAQSDNFLKSNNYHNNNYNAPHFPTFGSFYHNTGILDTNQINSFDDYLKTRLTMRNIAQPDYRHNSLQDNEFFIDMLTMLRSIFQQPVSSTVEPLTTVSTTTTIGETFGTTKIQNTESTDLSQFSTTEPSMPSPHGTICMPMSMPENNKDDEQVQVKKIICYPAHAHQPSSQIDFESKPIEISGDIIEP